MMNALSEKEIEAIEKLELVGISKNEGKVLFYMLNTGKSLAIDIERAVNLRQPEVSVAAKKLTERGWIKSTPVRKNKGKGRPHHLYSFAMPKENVLKSINKRFGERIKAMEKERDTFNALIEARTKEQVKS